MMFSPEKPLKIAFNASALLSPRTGIGEYGFQIASGLNVRPEADPDFFYGLYWSKEVRQTPGIGTRKSLPWLRNNLPYTYQMRQYVQQRKFQAKCRQEAFDLYHEPNIVSLPFDGPTVITVHDLSWIKFPEFHPVKRLKAMNRYFEASLFGAKRILTDCEFIKQEIVNTFGIHSDSIDTIPLGASEGFHPKTAEETFQTLRAHDLTHGQYFLSVGTLEPRKNLSVVLDAFMALPQKIRLKHPLVIVGMSGWKSVELEEQLQDLCQAGEVRRLGFVSRVELGDIYAGANVFVFPSIYEGFGLPVLEAMSCAVPVIASNSSSIPEVVGESSFLKHPKDIDGFRQAMFDVITDTELRNELAQKAIRRSQGFSWKDCLTKTLKSYQKALT